jgi:hypothetical protein
MKRKSSILPTFNAEWFILFSQINAWKVSLTVTTITPGVKKAKTHDSI